MAASGHRSSDAPVASPRLVPCLMISRGRVMLPGDEGPVPALSGEGGPLDLFEVADRFLAEFHRLYVVDLDGIERDQPELDYLQEIARGGEVWVDAGVRDADGAIDVLVAGAHRAVLSTAFLSSEREVKRAWRLSSDLVVELEVRQGVVGGRTAEWLGRDVPGVAQRARELGPADLVLGFREDPVDWSAVRTCAAAGPVWVGGTFRETDAAALASSRAAGGIFHLNARLTPNPPALSSS